MDDLMEFPNRNDDIRECQLRMNNDEERENDDDIDGMSE